MVATWFAPLPCVNLRGKAECAVCISEKPLCRRWGSWPWRAEQGFAPSLHVFRGPGFLEGQATLGSTSPGCSLQRGLVWLLLSVQAQSVCLEGKLTTDLFTNTTFKQFLGNMAIKVRSCCRARSWEVSRQLQGSGAGISVLKDAAGLESKDVCRCASA